MNIHNYFRRLFTKQSPPRALNKVRVDTIAEVAHWTQFGYRLKVGRWQSYMVKEL